MATLDVFKADAFSSMSLLAAIEHIDYKPQLLGSLGIFEPQPQRTTVVAVEQQDMTLALIQTTPRGAPLAQQASMKRELRNFTALRIAKGDRLNADEVQDIRAFGSESELQQVQVEVARRLVRLQADVELTWENMRLGAVQGIVKDADASTIVNLYTEFGVVQPAEVGLNIAATAAGALRPKIEAITRPLIRECKGAFTAQSGIVALCGDNFWDDLVNHTDVRSTYLNWEAAAALREPTAFGAFRFAGVEWINYRGTDDGSTVAVPTDEAKFFPVRAPGTFKVAWAPGEFMPVVNMPGVPLLPMIVPDEKRQAFVDIEVYSYPFFICTRPLTLRRARRGA